MPLPSHGQSFSDYKLYLQNQEILDIYTNDSIIVESTTYPLDMVIMTKCEDKITDSLYFTLHHNNYLVYVPYLHTIYKAYGIRKDINVSDHFLSLIYIIRKEQIYYK